VHYVFAIVASDARVHCQLSQPLSTSCWCRWAMAALVRHELTTMECLSTRTLWFCNCGIGSSCALPTLSVFACKLLVQVSHRSLVMHELTIMGFFSTRTLWFRDCGIGSSCAMPFLSDLYIKAAGVDKHWFRTFLIPSRVNYIFCPLGWFWYCLML
jgi:hypothetical protein